MLKNKLGKIGENGVFNFSRGKICFFINSFGIIFNLCFFLCKLLGLCLFCEVFKNFFDMSLIVGGFLGVNCLFVGCIDRL